MLKAVLFLLALPGLIRGLEEAPRAAATGAWSRAVADDRGYAVRGRLVLCEKRINAERREVAVYVELQDASDFVGHGMRLYCEMGKTDFRPEHRNGLRCEMRDKSGRRIAPTGYPFGGAVPLSEWVSLPVDATIRLRTTPFGLYRPGAMAVSPGLGDLWVIDDGDSKEYLLSGTFTVDPAAGVVPPPGEAHVWRGTLVLPPARLTGRPK